MENNRWNALYLISAITMIFMALAVAAQPLFLRQFMGISLDTAGQVNANVQVATEVLALMAVGGLGFLSDRFGRVPIMVVGFMVGACGGFLAPASFNLGAALGVGGVVFYYFSRIIMVFGTSAVWPQLTTLAGDFTNFKSRVRHVANANFMMAFGSTLAFTVLMRIPQYTGIAPVMFFNAFLGIVGAWLAHRYLVDNVPKRSGETIPWRTVWAVFQREPRIRIAFAVSIFSRSDIILIGLFYMLWTLYFADLVGKSQEEAAAHGGQMIGYVGMILMATILIWGQVMQRIGRLRSVIVGLAISGLGFVLMIWVVNPFDWFVYIPMTLIALGQASSMLGPDILALDFAPKDIRGSIMGPLNMVSGIGLIIILEVGGILFDTVGPYAPFLFTGIGNIVVLAYAYSIFHSKVSDAEDDSIAG
jgi:MFS family permease